MCNVHFSLWNGKLHRKWSPGCSQKVKVIFFSFKRDLTQWSEYRMNVSEDALHCFALFGEKVSDITKM